MSWFFFPCWMQSPAWVWSHFQLGREWGYGFTGVSLRGLLLLTVLLRLNPCAFVFMSIFMNEDILSPWYLQRMHGVFFFACVCFMMCEDKGSFNLFSSSFCVSPGSQSLFSHVLDLIWIRFWQQRAKASSRLWYHRCGEQVHLMGLLRMGHPLALDVHHPKSLQGPELNGRCALLFSCNSCG